MKKLVCLILVFLSGCAAAMPVKPEDQTYQKVFELPKQSKEIIFEKSKQWIALNFRSAKSVIEYDNKAEGVIIGNGAVPRPSSVVNPLGGNLITYSMREDIKDEKIRLTFDKLTALVSPGGEFPIVQADLEGMKSSFDSLSEGLQKYIIGENKDNW